MAPETLNSRQAKFIQAMLTAADVEHAAHLAGVSIRAARRWMATPGFRERLASAEGEALHLAGKRLSGLAGEALDTLQALLKSDTEGIRLRAANSILENMLRVLEIREFDERLARLEAQSEKH